LVALTLAGLAPSVVAQSASTIPMRTGINVDLPVTNNAVAVPDADSESAVVVTVTQNGSMYLGVNLISTVALGNEIRDALSSAKEKTLFLKADARISWASLIRILDVAHKAGVERLTLLTAQQDSIEQAPLVSPKGLELRVVRPRTVDRKSAAIDAR
jgi:biopolymer transport protein ExbD